MIIGITGPARCGKDEVAKYLSEKYNYEYFDFSTHTIIPEVKKRGLEFTKENTTQTAKAMREEFGRNFTGERMFELVKGKNNVVIAGFRIIEEVNTFKENFILILVSASPEIRYQRELTKRQISKEDFLKRDNFDLKNFGMQQVFDAADYKIDNSSTIDELHKSVDILMEKLK